MSKYYVYRHIFHRIYFFFSANLPIDRFHWSCLRLEPVSLHLRESCCCHFSNQSTSQSTSFLHILSSIFFSKQLCLNTCPSLLAFRFPTVLTIFLDSSIHHKTTTFISEYFIKTYFLSRILFHSHISKLSINLSQARSINDKIPCQTSRKTFRSI